LIVKELWIAVGQVGVTGVGIRGGCLWKIAVEKEIQEFLPLVGSHLHRRHGVASIPDNLDDLIVQHAIPKAQERGCHANAFAVVPVTSGAELPVRRLSRGGWLVGVAGGSGADSHDGHDPGEFVRADVKPPAGRIESRSGPLRAAMHVPAIEALFPAPWSTAARRMLPSPSPQLTATAMWGPVLAWCVLELLAESIDAENPEPIALDLFDRLRLREPFAQVFTALGLEGEEAWRVAARVKVGLLTGAGAGRPEEAVPAKDANDAISAEALAPEEEAQPFSPALWLDPDVRWLTGVHRVGTQEYLVRESYEELLWWLLMPSLLRLAGETTPNRIAANRVAVDAMSKSIEKALAAAEAAEYRVDLLMPPVAAEEPAPEAVPVAETGVKDDEVATEAIPEARIEAAAKVEPEPSAEPESAPTEEPKPVEPKIDPAVLPEIVAAIEPAVEPVIDTKIEAAADEFVPEEASSLTSRIEPAESTPALAAEEPALPEIPDSLAAAEPEPEPEAETTEPEAAAEPAFAEEPEPVEAQAEELVEPAIEPAPGPLAEAAFETPEASPEPDEALSVSPIVEPEASTPVWVVEEPTQPALLETFETFIVSEAKPEPEPSSEPEPAPVKEWRLAEPLIVSAVEPPAEPAFDPLADVRRVEVEEPEPVEPENDFSIESMTIIPVDEATAEVEPEPPFEVQFAPSRNLQPVEPAVEPSFRLSDFVVEGAVAAPAPVQPEAEATGESSFDLSRFIVSKREVEPEPVEPEINFAVKPAAEPTIEPAAEPVAKPVPQPVVEPIAASERRPSFAERLDPPVPTTGIVTNPTAEVRVVAEVQRPLIKRFEPPAPQIDFVAKPAVEASSDAVSSPAERWEPPVPKIESTGAPRTLAELLRSIKERWEPPAPKIEFVAKPAAEAKAEPSKPEDPDGDPPKPA